MKKLLKKTLAIALAATLVLGAGPLAGLCGLELPSISSFVASAAEEEPVWTVATDDMLRIEGNTIIGYTDKLSGNIEIPAKTSNGTAITTIDSSAFKGCSDLTALKIPENITKIGYYPFQNCSKLETIYFNATNCAVNSSTNNYSGCTAFTKIVFGEKVTAIPDNACIGASALQTVVFEGTVTKIGANAFNGCSSLTGVDLSNVTEIGDNAFANCISVPSFTFSENLKTIGSSAFIGCNMTEITIPENVTKIGYYPFQNCSKLETIYFNATNCAVNSSTNNYSGCTAFTKIVFGENVTAIPANVCINATALQTVVFKGTVTKIGANAFSGCSSLTGVDLSNVTEIGDSAFTNCISIPSFTFSENLKTIGSSAFIGCNMTEITIPENVTKIGYYPFQNCSKLETICFNATNCTVNSNTNNYNGCTAFTKIVFGENVTAIPANVCINATALQTVVFKGTVTKIGADAFNGCSSLTGVDLSNVTEIGDNAFTNCISIPSFTFSENLKTIGSSAFIGCNMTEITIPENVTKIGYYPFQNCTKLQTVYFNAANCAVNSSTNNYSGCTAFTKIVFGENVTAIPAYACYYAKALQKVEILGEFTSIGSDAFKGCTALNEIHLDAYSKESFDFNALKIGSGNDVVTEDIFTFGLYNVTYPNTSNDIDVTVSCNSKTFEAEVKLSVTETAGEREKGSIAISDKEISEQIGCFNIKMILADGSSTSAVQPNGKVTVKMAIPANYIGKTNFKIVHRTGDGQRENFATNPKGSEKQLSVSSDGKYWIFEVTSFSEFEFFAVEAAPTVSIKNNTGSKTISYGETLRLTANSSNMPADAKIFWYVDGIKKGEGATFEVSPESGSVEVTVKVVDANGNNYAGADISDTEKVTVKSGFFQKLISFFKNLFGISRVVAQAFMEK